MEIHNNMINHILAESSRLPRHDTRVIIMKLDEITNHRGPTATTSADKNGCEFLKRYNQLSGIAKQHQIQRETIHISDSYQCQNLFCHNEQAGKIPIQSKPSQTCFRKDQDLSNNRR